MGSVISTKYSFTKLNDVIPIDYQEDLDHVFVEALSLDYGAIHFQFIKIHNWEDILTEIDKIVKQYDPKLTPQELCKNVPKISVRLLDPVHYFRKKTQTPNHHYNYVAYGIYVNNIHFKVGNFA